MPKTLLFSLLLTSVQIANAGTVDTLEIFSPSMQRKELCVVILPGNYRSDGPPYPVLYLLHGWSGNYSGWINDAPQLPLWADEYNMIIVCPDGGYDSWYLDSPVDTTVRYETHVAKEVVTFIDQHYHTRKERAGRAIAGLSMGGHGAFYLAARHPELFGAVGSMAGGLDLRPFRKNNWDLEGVLGDTSHHWANWEAVSAVNLVPALKAAGQAIIIDCGEEDFFLETNREMHRRLLEADIPHVYTERPGGHNGDYWGLAVDYEVLFFHKFFEQR